MVVPAAPPKALQTRQADVALALSGGGVRAFLYGLGALRAVVGAQTANRKLTTLVGVSGGGIAGAYATSRQDIGTATLATYDEQVLRPAVEAVTRRSIMFGAWQFWLVALASVSLLVATVALAVHGLGLPAFLRGVLAALAFVLFLVIFGARGWAIEQGLRRVLFPKRQTLRDVDGPVQLVLQTTDLNSGEATYLTSRKVSSKRWGEDAGTTVELVRAVRATATFPIVLPALQLSGLRLLGGLEKRAPKRLALVDGGVYDNMGSEWLLNPDRTADDVYKIVVNASRNLQAHTARFSVPGWSELAVLLREKDIQYDSTTAPRRRWLRDLFKHRIQTGTLVLIDGHLQRWVNSFSSFSDARGERARALLPGLTRHSAVWQRWYEENGSVGTHLNRLDRRRAADLVRAGYLATAIQTHVLEAWPAPVALDPAEVLPWLDGEAPQTSTEAR